MEMGRPMGGPFFVLQSSEFVCDEAVGEGLYGSVEKHGS